MMSTVEVDLLDEAWHALFHMVDAFNPVHGGLRKDDQLKYQQQATAEAERVMALLHIGKRK